MEGVALMRKMARVAKATWYGQWDGRYVMVTGEKHGPSVEAAVVKLGRVTRYQCGTKDVILLEAQPLSRDVAEVLKGLSLLPSLGPDGLIVRGPKHVLESASARLEMKGVRTRLHGHELRVMP